MQRVNDARAASRRHSRHSLRKLEIGIHTRGGIQKEHLKQAGGLDGIAVLASDLISGTQRRHGITQLTEHLAVLGEVARIGLAIALNIGQSVGGLRVWPPVIAIGIKIMNPAFAQTGRPAGDGYRRLCQRKCGCRKNAVMIQGGDIHFSPYPLADREKQQQAKWQNH